MSTITKSIKAVAGCSASESNRYAINGVLLRKDADGATVAVATDGRILVAQQMPATEDGGAAESIIPRKTIIEGAKTCTRTHPAAAVTLTETHGKRHGEIGSNGTRVSYGADEGQFPRIDGITPGTAPRFTIKLNVKNLERVLACVPIGADGSRLCYLGIGSDSDDCESASPRPMAVWTGLECEWDTLGLVMPVGGDEGKPIERGRVMSDYDRCRAAALVAHPQPYK